jgi:predicted amidohydrolase
MLAVAMANYPRFGGNSCAFDGIALTPEDGTPRDHCIAQAGTSQEIALARINLDALRSYRQAGPLGDADRKPRTYASIAETSPPHRRGHHSCAAAHAVNPMLTD